VVTVAAPAAHPEHGSCRAGLRALRGHWIAAGAGAELRDVLTALWCHADADNATFVAVRTLAAELGRAPSTVQKHLRHALALGLITADNHGARTRTTRRLCAPPSEAQADPLELMVAALGLDGAQPCGQRAESADGSARPRGAQTPQILRAPGARVSTYLEDAEKRGSPWVVDDDGTAWPACELEAVG
jgi:hypothetical protein